MLFSDWHDWMAVDHTQSYDKALRKDEVVQLIPVCLSLIFFLSNENTLGYIWDQYRHLQADAVLLP